VDLHESIVVYSIPFIHILHLHIIPSPAPSLEQEREWERERQSCHHRHSDVCVSSDCVCAWSGVNS